MSTYRMGALAVVENQRPHSSLDKDLKSLDSRLFFEQQMTLTGDVVWCVVLGGSGDHPPYTILEWRDDITSKPIELNSGVLVRVRQMMQQGDASKLGSEAAKANQAFIEKRREQMHEELKDMIDDLVPRMKDTRALWRAPRGQYLHLARSKARARGEKV